MTIWFTICWQSIALPGFPIRIPTDRCLLSTPRGFSQIAASFVGSWCQGIPLALFVAWPLVWIFSFFGSRRKICSLLPSTIINLLLYHSILSLFSFQGAFLIRFLLASCSKLSCSTVSFELSGNLLPLSSTTFCLRFARLAARIFGFL